MIGALAPALPGRVTAAGSHFANPTCGGFDPRRNRRTVVYELILSGTAARADRDGCEAMSMAFNASNIPVESQEANQPVLIERFELIRDSAGAGRYRGGTGIRRDLRFFLQGGRLTNNTERHRFGPWGLFGGQPGKPGVTLVNPGTPAERRVHSRPPTPSSPATSSRSSSPGPAGTARPGSGILRRCSTTSLEDYVSLEGARQDYGVVIDPATMTVDEAATAAARAAMRRPARVPSSPAWGRSGDAVAEAGAPWFNDSDAAPRGGEPCSDRRFSARSGPRPVGPRSRAGRSPPPPSPTTAGAATTAARR